MVILPAIDLRGGQVVRLSKGDFSREKVYAPDPAQVAQEFIRAGARWIHVVDLDAARTGQRANAEVVRAICRAGAAQVELGGGIRDDESLAAALDLGVSRVIIGSAALKDWAWFDRLARRGDPYGVALSLDARQGRLAAHGWVDASELTLETVADRLEGLPLAALIYTDIERDGMLTGPDLKRTAWLVQRTRLPVIASGGISSLEDVRRCMDIGCAGAILGRALYEGRVSLSEACALVAGR